MRKFANTRLNTSEQNQNRIIANLRNTFRNRYMKSILGPEDLFNHFQELSELLITDVIIGKQQSVAQITVNKILKTKDKDTLVDNEKLIAIANKLFAVLSDCFEQLGSLAADQCREDALDIIKTLNFALGNNAVRVEFQDNIFGKYDNIKLASHGKSYIRRQIAKAEIVIATFVYLYTRDGNMMQSELKSIFINSCYDMVDTVIKYIRNTRFESDAHRFFNTGNLLIRLFEIVYNITCDNPYEDKNSEYRPLTYNSWHYPINRFSYLDCFNDVRIEDDGIYSHMSYLPRTNITKKDFDKLGTNITSTKDIIEKIVVWNPQEIIKNSPIEFATRAYKEFQELLNNRKMQLSIEEMIYHMGVASFDYERRFVTEKDRPCRSYPYMAFISESEELKTYIEEVRTQTNEHEELKNNECAMISLFVDGHLKILKL